MGVQLDHLDGDVFITKKWNLIPSFPSTPSIVRNEVAQVMFLQASVCPRGGAWSRGGGGVHGPGGVPGPRGGVCSWGGVPGPVRVPSPGRVIWSRAGAWSRGWGSAPRGEGWCPSMH